MSTKIIDETTLRVYFPRNPNADLISATAEPLLATTSSAIDQDRASTSGQGYQCTRSTSAINSILTFIIYDTAMPHDFIWIHFVDLPDKNTSSDPDTVMEGYGTFLKGPQTTGAEGIMSNVAHK